MSLIGKIGYYAPKAFGYAKRFVYASPYILFEDAANAGAKAAASVAKSEKIGFGKYLKNVIKEGGRGIEGSIKESLSKISADAAKTVGTKASVKYFFKAAWKSIKEIPTVLKTSAKWGAGRAKVTAKAAGKTGFALKLAGAKGGFKGFFKGVGKKSPLIGNLMLVAIQLPNIIKATKEKGIGQGVAEAAKAGARLTGASILSAVGTTVAGPIGGLIGFAVGDWLTSKIVGKSYTEKQEQEKQKDEEALERVQQMQQEGRLPNQTPQVTQTPAFTSNPFNAYQPNPFDSDNFSNPYANDMYMQNMKFNTIA